MVVIRLLHAFIALALFTAANLHLPALQVVAWTGMIISYSKDRTLAEAVSMTFDGEHPCPMCKTIKKQQSERTEKINGIAQAPRLIAILDIPSRWTHEAPFLHPVEHPPLNGPARSSEPERFPPRIRA